MTDNPNLGYYKPSQGSLTGFDLANIPDGNPNIAVTGWSIEQLRAFLTNQSDINFPSNEWIQRIEAMIRNHEADFNNPHRTSLDQIVGDFIRQMLGSIVPGTVPEIPPFFSFDAQYSLPLGGVFPATYTPANLYRLTAGGWLIDPSTEPNIVGSDYLSNRAGVPLFSSMVNVSPVAWSTASGFTLNTAISDLTAGEIEYPFTFKTVSETAVTGQFGVNITSTQELQTIYTTSFFLYKTAVGGKVRIYQPSDISSYVEIDLNTAECLVYANNMLASAVKHTDEVIRVSVQYKSFPTIADNRLRIVHLNPGQTSGDGTRAGTAARKLFSIAQPQTTKSSLGQPTMKNLGSSATTSPLIFQFNKINAPTTMSNVTMTFALDLYPMLETTPVNDPTIFTMGPLTITRTQKTIRVSVSGSPIFTSDILDGYNVITLSYSPTTLIFKDLLNARQTATGVYPTLPTNSVSMGPFAGYLHRAAFYAQSDKSQIVEYLNNG